MRSATSWSLVESWAEAAPLEAPPVGVVAFNRMAFGPRPGDLDAFEALGGTDEARLLAFVDQQLAPESIDDSEAEARIAASGFTTINKSLSQLWVDHAVGDPDWEVRIRPVVETQLSTFIRAVYSRRQLLQVLADFWHNHFNVYGWDFWEAPVFVHYDRDVIRPNVLGNFRTMLEAVAKSTDMLFYLDNWQSSKDGPNENFARELLELHTLGSENYFGAIPRNQVPTDGDGIAVGFVDEDVFSVARCLTGWSVDGDPWWDPTTGNGTYLYRHDWHDLAAKNVLGLDLPANQPAEKDGHDVLDLLAAHPGTGRYIARKLCSRLIGDQPPEGIVDAAAAVFTAQVDAPDQIAQVVRAILLSDEFRSTWGDKVKRPFEIAVSTLRAGDADFPFIEGNGDTDTFEWLYYNTGQYLFGWHPPNGYPDFKEAWISSGPRVMGWRLTNWLIDVQDSADTYRMDAVSQTPPQARSARAITEFWVDRILGRPATSETSEELIDFMAQGRNPDFDLPLDTDVGTQERLQTLLGLIFMTPEFL
ncbi:MAG: DUF1800 domain-containing protein, partial [Thermoanaerobaculia bacterium]